VRDQPGEQAICSMVSGVVPVEPPTPVLSNVMTRRVAASASISAGSQLSRFQRHGRRRRLSQGSDAVAEVEFEWAPGLQALREQGGSAILCRIRDDQLAETAGVGADRNRARPAPRTERAGH
jgi:hypothetical protein